MWWGPADCRGPGRCWTERSVYLRLRPALGPAGVSQMGGLWAALATIGGLAGRKSRIKMPDDGRGSTVMRPVIEMRAVSKHYGRVVALDGVNFSIYSDEIVGLVGDNGAGKS